MARNKYGIIPIKIRAKDTSTIDLSAFGVDDLAISGNIKDAKGGKLIFLDIYIEDIGGNAISFNGITSLQNDIYIYVLVYNDGIPELAMLYYDGSDIDYTAIVS